MKKRVKVVLCSRKKPTPEISVRQNIRSDAAFRELSRIFIEVKGVNLNQKGRIEPKNKLAIL